MEAVARFDFLPKEEDELEFKKGAIMTILSDDEDILWSKAKLYKTIGLVPKNFIRFKALPGCIRKISKSDSEDLLAVQPQDHSYIVRESETSPTKFSISVKHDKEVRHFIILADEEHRYFVLDKKFPSINLLADYHRNHTLCRNERVILSHPVPIEVKARVNFRTNDPKELSFTRGEFISVTKCSDRNWWTGINEANQSGDFPVSYVVPVDFPA